MPKLTDRLPLGDGLAVSPLCLGIVEEPSVVSAAYEAGINFFFLSADMHWPLYEFTRKGLQDLLTSKPSARDDIVVGAVCYVTQPEFVWVPFEEILWSVPALKHIDLTIAGGSYGREIGNRLPEFQAHKKRRHVGARAIGASFHDRRAACDAVANESFDINYVRYNPTHAGAARDVYAQAKARADGRKTLLYNFKSTGGYIREESEYARLGIAPEFWRPHITDYYRFAFTQPNVDGALIALPHDGAVQELADALAKGPLDEDDHQYLLDLAELQSGQARLAS